MKKLLSALKKLGFPRQVYYLICYPFTYLRKVIGRVDTIHEEIRWIKIANDYLNLLEEKEIPKVDAHFAQEIREYYKPIGEYINMDDFRIFFHFTGIKSKQFVPHYIFHNHIVPVLNPNPSHVIYQNKNNYDRLFAGFQQPQTFLRFMHGRYYNSDYQPLSEKLAHHSLLDLEQEWIIKPSLFSNSGSGVFSGSSDGVEIRINGTPFPLGALERKYPHGFIIQEKIRQTKLLTSFHPESLNTLRVFTLRLGSEIITLPGSYARFGTGGNHVDNMGSGGVGCGVKSNGDLTHHGISSNLKTVYSHPDSGIEFKGIHLSFYKDVSFFVEEIHRVSPLIDLFAWDIAVNEMEEPVLIEVNTRYPNSMNPQLLNGPFFGDHTDRVLQHTIR